VKTRFDFIVVGAGSSGCALAHHLTQFNPDADIALLEAGERDWRPMVHVPLGFAFLLGDRPGNWSYRTEPIPQLGGRQLDLPRGKMLGGTSSLNGMVYVRGQREDFDGWAAAGNPGWAYEDVLPYFKRSEHHHRGGDPYHGGTGPLFVTPVVEPFPITAAFIEAASRHGLNRNADFNGVRQAGVGLFEANIRKGRRHSAARAFLGKARPTNLTVLTHANVRSLRWQRKRVTGLHCERRGKPLDLVATREVILSAAVAGAFFSTDPADARPDTQVHFAAAASRPDEKGRMIPIPAITASVCFLRPSSRGSSHIHSKDAEAAPHIQPNYMSAEEDRIRTVEAIRILRDILATSPFADHVEEEIRPGASVSSDEDLLEYIRNDGDSVHHAVGTCKMGNDEGSVVDDRLRVHGTEGLRVADGSIMPAITSGNTHAACVMIGEKAADLISAP
jgi:choline dehydrogenase